MSDDHFMRDDIIQLSNKLDSQCFNVKAYRKHKSKSKKVSILGALTTDLGFSQQNILKSNNSMDKKLFSQQQLPQQKRISVTAGIKKRGDLSQNLRNFNRSVNIRQHNNQHQRNSITAASHKKQQSFIEQIKTAKINYNNNNNSNNSGSQSFRLHDKSKFMWMDNQPTGRAGYSSKQLANQQPKESSSSAVKNKYKQLQYQYHKTGPINDRAIQNWLNQILTEYCHQQQFDKSIENSALKKMSIDRNSLLSQGINPQYVNRVYKSMFVYSIGFNNLLKQLSGKNSMLKKTIWKVYAILLQFCSQGTFQTMIGEIQRDKARKIQSLREQIEKRQKIIENNDEINQQKNAKIYKQLKVLREQNANLQNQKNVLIQDFKEAEQSFNQQVSMRLKFQNKINEIHGIHHQLSTKHARLYDDYHKKVTQIQTLQKNYKQLAQNFIITRQKLSRTSQQLEQKKRDNLSMNQLITTYQQMRTRFQNSQIQLKNSKQDLQNIIKQKLRKISQLQVELQNNEIMLNLSKSSSKQLQQQYRQQLQQNKKLYSTIRQQITQLNQLFTQKKQFNDKHMSYVAEIQFLKNKDSQSKLIIQKIKIQTKQLTQTNHTLMIQKITMQKKLQNLQRTLTQCYQNIQQMKRTKNIYQQELIYLKKKSQTHGQVVREKDLLILTLTKSNQKLTKQNQEMLVLNKNLDSKATVLAQKLKSQQEINRKKYQKLKQQRDILYKQNTQHNGILQQKINQLQKYMSLYDNETLNLKNQRFQRVNLDLRYKQSLQVMQSQNQHIKKLNIIISQNHQQIQQWKRKYRNFEYILKQKQHLFQVQKNSLKMYLQQTRKQLERKKMFVNPMLLEDLRGLLKRAIQKYDMLLVLHNKTIKQHKARQQHLNHTIQQNLHQHTLQIQQLQHQSAKHLQQKQSQLQYQRQKQKHLQYKISQYQKLIQQHNLQQQNPNNYKQKQRKYLNTIKDKSQHIQKLLKQLQNAHDHNNTLIKRITQIEQIMNKKNDQISQLQKQLTKLGQQYEVMEKMKINNGRQKESLQSRMDDYDEGNLLSAMNNNNNNETNTHSNQKQYQKSYRFTNNNNQTSLLNNNRQSSQQSNRKLQSKQKIIDNNRDQSIINNTNSFIKNKQQKSEKLVNPIWRNDLGKKLKHALNYYQK